jgi:hypothetical protein
MNWLTSLFTASATDHFTGRSRSWWTGKNSWWGKLTGGGTDNQKYDVKVSTKREEPKQFPYVLLAIAYFVLK